MNFLGSKILNNFVFDLLGKFSNYTKMRGNIVFILLKIQYFCDYKISKNPFLSSRKLINRKGQINPMLKIHLVSYDLLIILCLFISFNLHSQLIADALLGQVSRKCSHLCHFCPPLWLPLSSLNIQFWFLLSNTPSTDT